MQTAALTVPAPPAPPAPLVPPVSHAAYLNNAPPAYPKAARQRGMQGQVVLLVEVSAEGRVSGLRVKTGSGFDILDRAAVEAVRNWRFVPARRGAVAEAATVEVPIRFDLQQN